MEEIYKEKYTKLLFKIQELVISFFLIKNIIRNEYILIIKVKDMLMCY